MQQNLTQKTKQVLIHQILLKKADLASLKSDDIDKLKNLASGLNSLKSK